MSKEGTLFNRVSSLAAIATRSQEEFHYTRAEIFGAATTGGENRNHTTNKPTKGQRHRWRGRVPHVENDAVFLILTIPYLWSSW